LLFNEAIPASVSNRATHVRLPAPIVIEKLMPLSEERENMDSTRSSTSFTVLSEERLQAAIKLAKRDLRRRRLESLIKSPAKPSQEASLLETSDVELLQVIEFIVFEKIEEPLEPEEQNKLEIRRQKQAARSARSIYVLQQQVKEIQDDIEKLRSQKMWDTKKSTAINRLAAAHRGAQRALQVVIHQLSDLSHSKVPPHYKELGQLIRQLSLCSAKVQVDQGSAVPETALDILQKLEWRMASQKPKTTSQQPINRREVLRVGLESLVQQRELREQGNQMQDAGFQQPTVSSRLRVNELPQKERSVPWIPTSPHSPPPKAWLDKMTMQRLKELNQLSKEEAGRIERLRSEVVSPTQWAERAEQKARERIQPLLDEAQQSAENAEQLSEALLEDLLEDTARAAWAAETDRQLEGMAQCRLQAPTLESMLLRMEEIQAPGSRPASPQPIRLTRPVSKQATAADIVLEKPVETSPAEKSMGTRISVPGSMLRNVRQYREDYEAYLRVVAHEAVGSFNPWAIANLAEELLSEALTDVAAEFQDVVEEYAEAVFTSEFLQPT
uniref:Si:dkey-243i1.1 n=1 Tax=Seriola dumerili TaxID=41447 RepID=A0A3B4UBX5_SERDU